MEPLRKIEISNETKEAIKRALLGVKDKREEAFILLNGVPEEYLPDVVEYFRILNGLKEIKDQH